MRRVASFIVFICLCVVVYIIGQNPYITEGIAYKPGVQLDVAESQAYETIAFWWGMVGIGLFTALLFLSRTFRLVVAFILIVLGISKALSWLLNRRS
jgi:hypothetical protein